MWANSVFAANSVDRSVAGSLIHSLISQIPVRIHLFPSLLRQADFSRACSFRLADSISDEISSILSSAMALGDGVIKGVRWRAFITQEMS